MRSRRETSQESGENAQDSDLETAGVELETADDVRPRRRAFTLQLVTRPKSHIHRCTGCDCELPCFGRKCATRKRPVNYWCQPCAEQRGLTNPSTV